MKNVVALVFLLFHITYRNIYSFSVGVAGRKIRAKLKCVQYLSFRSVAKEDVLIKLHFSVARYSVLSNSFSDARDFVCRRSSNGTKVELEL